MVSMTAMEARRAFGRIISKTASDNEPIVITRNGRNIAALVSMADLQAIEQLVDAFENKIDAEYCLSALDKIDMNSTIPWEQVKQENNLL